MSEQFPNPIKKIVKKKGKFDTPNTCTWPFTFLVGRGNSIKSVRAELYEPKPPLLVKFM